MSIYRKEGLQIFSAYNIGGITINNAYSKDGIIVFSSGGSSPDYSNYSYTQKWASKGIGSTQGFFIYDEKVFWVSKSGDSSVPANCYVWNLSDGSQAYESQYITIYSGHGNSLDIAYPEVLAATAYSPAKVYKNEINSTLNEFTLVRTLNVSEDANYGHDACFDENDRTKMWTLAHTGAISQTGAPFQLSKWDLTNLVDNGDGTYAPLLINTQQITQPSASPYFQGMRMHDGIIWFACGYSGSSTAHVYGVDPTTGSYLYDINCETTEEPEGVAWYPDATVPGGYAMYVGFQGMMLRKYTFTEAVA